MEVNLYETEGTIKDMMIRPKVVPVNACLISNAYLIKEDSMTCQSRSPRQVRLNSKPPALDRYRYSSY